MVPEAVFLNRAEAEQDRKRRELAPREFFNPFSFDWRNLTALTSTRLAVFRQKLAELGLTLPPPRPSYSEDNVEYREWWDRESANWTPEQRAGVWDVFDKVRLFEVVEIELE